MKTKFILHGGYTSEMNDLNQGYFAEMIGDVSDGGNILLVYFASKDDRIEEKYQKDSDRLKSFVENKKYSYTLTEQKNNMVHIDCKAACVGQEFEAEDVGALILDLPNLIEAEQAYQEKQSGTIRFRTTAEQRKKIESSAKASGKSVSKFVRDLALKV